MQAYLARSVLFVTDLGKQLQRSQACGERYFISPPTAAVLRAWLITIEPRVGKNTSRLRRYARPAAGSVLPSGSEVDTTVQPVLLSMQVSHVEAGCFARAWSTFGQVCSVARLQRVSLCIVRSRIASIAATADVSAIIVFAISSADRRCLVSAALVSRIAIRLSFTDAASRSHLLFAQLCTRTSQPVNIAMSQLRLLSSDRRSGPKHLVQDICGCNIRSREAQTGGASHNDNR